ncbi:MAG: hypothetical protein JKY65_34470 [Planctomycetes bacterium]|nr:hypothetical protein [Planctomycetota bacterium]
MGAAFLAYLFAESKKADRNDYYGRSRQSRSRTIGERMSLVAQQIPGGQMIRTGHTQTVTGVLNSRRVTIRSRKKQVEYHVEAPGLRLADACITSWNGAFEIDYSAGEAESVHAAVLVSDPVARQALSSLLEMQQIEAVYLSQGSVMALGPGERLAPTRAKRVFRDLHAIATAADAITASEERIFQRSKISAFLKTEAPPTSGQAIDWSARICPYCKDSLETGARAACGQCQTVQHAECFTELGRCPTTGCGGILGFPVAQTHERAKVVIPAGPCNECGLRSQGCTATECHAGAMDRGLHSLHGRRRTRRTGG